MSICPNIWFIAEAAFEAAVDDANDGEPLFERLLFLVGDVDLASAEIKAGRIAREKEHSYLNGAGQKVTWRLIRIDDVREMVDQVFEDGSEIRSEMTGPAVGDPRTGRTKLE